MVNHKFSLRATTASLIALSTLTGCVSTGSLFGHHDSNSPQASYEETMRVAASARESGDLTTSAEMYGRAASFATTDAGPLIQLADVYWQMKNPEKSAETLEKARVLNGNNVIVLRNLGRAYVATGDFKKAEDAYMAAMQIDSGDARIYNGLGIAFDLDGDHSAAQDHFREGLKVAPNDLDLRNNLAYSFISTQSYDQAIKLLEPLYLAGLSTPRLRQNLALAYALADRDPEARKVAEEDLSPAEVERNMAVYNHLRDNGASRQDLMAMGRPTFTRGGLTPASTQTAEPPKAEVAAAEPAPTATEPALSPVEPVANPDAASVPPVTAPTEITLTPAADQQGEHKSASSEAPKTTDTSAVDHVTEPVVLTAPVVTPPAVEPVVTTAPAAISANVESEIKLASASGDRIQTTPEPAAPVNTPEDLTKTAPTAASQVAALPVAEPNIPTPTHKPAAAEPTAAPLEIPTIAEMSAPAAIEPAAAPAVVAGADLSAPASTIGFGGPKVYLGQFANDGEARETWIKVWTNNSALLGSLVASIEPSNSKTALFAVGSGSAEQAADICVKLRAAGVSCGVAK